MTYAGNLRPRSRLVGSVGRVGKPVLERPAETAYRIDCPSSGYQRRILKRVPCVRWPIDTQIRVVLPLVDRDTDAGVFVVLDPMMPSRLAGAFPDGVEIKRLGLADTVAQVKGFLDIHGS